MKATICICSASHAGSKICNLWAHVSCIYSSFSNHFTIVRIHSRSRDMTVIYNPDHIPESPAIPFCQSIRLSSVRITVANPSCQKNSSDCTAILITPAPEASPFLTRNAKGAAKCAAVEQHLRPQQELYLLMTLEIRWRLSTISDNGWHWNFQNWWSHSSPEAMNPIGKEPGWLWTPGKPIRPEVLAKNPACTETNTTRRSP